MQMEPTENAALVALVSRRFQSFAEAAEAAVAGVAKSLPGTLGLGQFDSDGETCRVADLAGAPIPGLQRGAILRLAGADDDWLDRDLLRSVGIESSLVAPLEISEGKVVGLLFALATRAHAYGPDHMVLLGVAARILATEWEGVQTRAALRRLRDSGRESGRTDVETGLVNRATFLELLEREWKLVKRSSVRSLIVACQVEVEGPGNGHGSPIDLMGLKDAADVLAGSARTTDYVARTDASELVAVLVGCAGPDGAEAFIQRYHQALERATVGRPFAVRVSCAYQDLLPAESGLDALGRAVAASRNGPDGSTATD
jgi:GGDEF domain-containing protein